MPRPRLTEPISPFRSALAVTPSNTVDLPAVTHAIYIGGQGGDLKVNLADDSTAVVFDNLAAGVVHLLAVKRVFATGTSATDIVALY